MEHVKSIFIKPCKCSKCKWYRDYRLARMGVSAASELARKVAKTLLPTYYRWITQGWTSRHWKLNIAAGRNNNSIRSIMIRKALEKKGQR